jgi:branched-chain amino acid aminotransferase
MINYNGDLVESHALISNSNRSFLYGDGIFETIKVVNNRILFFEDHYFRLMASMRIVRMQIPSNFTLEFLESQILELAKANAIEGSARIRLTVFRNDGGFYLPATRQISYLIQAFALDSTMYKSYFDPYEVDLFKDFFIAKQLLSTLKTTNKMINITGSIYADENGFNNCLLLNNEKNVVEALNGNLFMLIDNKLITPPIADGCLNGIMRKQVLQLSKNNADITFIEQSISPFDLQKADELFITNVITGIQPITKYRKKDFKNSFALKLVDQLNTTFLI